MSIPTSARPATGAGRPASSAIRSVPADEVAFGESITGVAHLRLGLLRLDPAQYMEIGVTVLQQPKKGNLMSIRTSARSATDAGQSVVSVIRSVCSRMRRRWVSPSPESLT
jgi:hypothetical protein